MHHQYQPLDLRIVTQDVDCNTIAIDTHIQPEDTANSTATMRTFKPLYTLPHYPPLGQHMGRFE